MKKKLLYVLSVVAMATLISINISGALKDNSQSANLKTLNVLAIANAEDDTDSELLDASVESSVVCKCRPTWHNTCLSRSGGQTCADGSDCRIGDSNC